MRRLRTFRFRGLAAQIVLWTVLPLTLVLIGVAFTGVYSHEQAMRTLVQERDRALAMSLAGQVRERLLQWTAPLQVLAAHPDLAAGDADARRALLSGAAGGTPGPAALLDDGGSVLAAASGSSAWTEAPQALAALARSVTARRATALSPLLEPGITGGSLLVGVPVVASDGTLAGVLAASLPLSDLEPEAVLDQVPVGEHGIAYLVETSGSVLAHSASPHARATFAGHTGLAAAAESAGSGATLCHSPEGEQMALSFAPLHLGNGWLILVEQPWHAVMSPVLRYSQFVPLVAALAAVVAVLTLYYGIHSLVRPLRALKRQAEQVAWGEFDATSAPVGGVEEIEDLRRALDQMAQRIQGYQRGVHDYIAAITQGQEDERKRLARELHDDTAQSLIALGQQVEMAQKALASDPERAADRLGGVRALLAETLEAVRRFSRDLRPIYLEDLGFLPALEALARDAHERHGLSVEVQATGQVQRLDPDLELAAFRIAQEALNNVVQHAQAASARLEVRFEPDRLVLLVRDDGVGFEAPDQPDVLARRGHFGLMGIQERAALYGGKLTLRSAPNRGTELTVCLILAAGAAALPEAPEAQTSPT